MRFKKKKEQTELYPITYPLELVHLDFLSIGGKDDKMKSVLVVTDHFTCYAQCYVTKNQRVDSSHRTSKQVLHYLWMAGQNPNR